MAVVILLKISIVSSVVVRLLHDPKTDQSISCYDFKGEIQ